jgi:hypothetical protein
MQGWGTVHDINMLTRRVPSFTSIRARTQPSRNSGSGAPTMFHTTTIQESRYPSTYSSPSPSSTDMSRLLSTFTLRRHQSKSSLTTLRITPSSIRRRGYTQATLEMAPMDDSRKYRRAVWHCDPRAGHIRTSLGSSIECCGNSPVLCQPVEGFSVLEFV